MTSPHAPALPSVAPLESRAVALNTALHVQILQGPGPAPSTRASAQAALERLRQEKILPKSV